MINEMSGESLSAIESTHYINIILYAKGIIMPTMSVNKFLIILTEKLKIFNYYSISCEEEGQFPVVL
jgi:hypothetical protein